jgi:hypothetical protein
VKKNIVALVMICASVMSLAIGAPARAQTSKNTVGPSLLIGSGNTSVGVDAKFGVSDNLSIRPFIFFPSSGTTFGTSLTYDFDTSSSSKFQITPFLGGGVSVGSSNSGGNSTTTTYFTGGADFGVTDSVDLKAALDVPLTSNNSSTNVRLGAGFKF